MPVLIHQVVATSIAPQRLKGEFAIHEIKDGAQKGTLALPRLKAVSSKDGHTGPAQVLSSGPLRAQAIEKDTPMQLFADT
jgi:hypothetical protein